MLGITNDSDLEADWNTAVSVLGKKKKPSPVWQEYTVSLLHCLLEVSCIWKD